MARGYATPVNTRVSSLFQEASTKRTQGYDPVTMEFGIIGLGTHGAHHARLLAEMGHEVIGVDADPDARTRFHSQFDAPVFDAPEEIFDRDLTAIVITTPNKFHEPTAVPALEAGFDLLIEKPLAHTLESAQRIEATAKDTGNICAVSFSNKFQTVCRVARSYVTDGDLGEITHVRARHVRRRGIPGRGTWYTSNEIAGGGALMDIGANLINLLLYLTGWPTLEETMVTTRSDFGKQDDYAYLEMYGEDDQARMYDVEDSVVGFCEFENGMTASIEIAWAANTTEEHVYTIQGTGGGARLEVPNDLSDITTDADVANDLYLFETRSTGADHFIDSEVTVPLNNPFEAELTHFLEALEAGDRPALNNVDQAVQVQRVIDQFYDAST